MAERSYTVGFRLSTKHIAMLEKEAAKHDPLEGKASKERRGRKPNTVSIHDYARMLVVDALERTDQKNLLAGQEVIAEKLDETFEEVAALREEMAEFQEKLAGVLKSVLKEQSQPQKK